MFFLFQSWDLWDALADLTRLDFVMLIQNFWGSRWRYSKLVKYLIYRNFFSIRRNKSGKLWSINLGDLDVKLYPCKAPLSEDHILVSRGCCAPKFLHTVQNDQVLLTNPQQGWGFPLQFFSKGVKNWLEMLRISHKNFGARESSLWNFATWRAARWVW